MKSSRSQGRAAETNKGEVPRKRHTSQGIRRRPADKRTPESGKGDSEKYSNQNTKRANYYGLGERRKKLFFPDELVERGAREHFPISEGPNLYPTETVL